MAAQKDCPDPIASLRSALSDAGFSGNNMVLTVFVEGLLLNAGGFVPKFSKSSTGIEVQVTCVDVETNFQMWYKDVVNMKKRVYKDNCQS